MKIYGKADRESMSPVALQEATLVLTVEEAVKLAEFFRRCADGMATNPDWEHAHLRDYCRSWSADEADLIVYAAARLT